MGVYMCMREGNEVMKFLKSNASALLSFITVFLFLLR
jgi:hypothetical protein